MKGNFMKNRNILVTGGAGFIGSQLVRHFVRKYKGYFICNLDNLTYAGNLENLKDIEGASNYKFIKGDITDKSLVSSIFDENNIDSVIHLAAESHVDRSIFNPEEFARTNVMGTLNLLNVAKELWNYPYNLFYHVSTDEVYGSLGETGSFSENSPYDPHSPYSASKASADHFVNAYADTYGLPVIISNCSNNYGPYQFPEKLIPLIIHNIKNQKPLPVYGQGSNIRDWLWVMDHVEAIDLIFHEGETGQKYNIGGNNEWKNIDLVKMICSLMDKKLKRKAGTSEQLITYVTDRPGHDQRYAIDAGKLEKTLNWKPSVNMEKGLEMTIDWYLSNNEWLENVTSGAYQKYYDEMYLKR